MEPFAPIPIFYCSSQPALLIKSPNGGEKLAAGSLHKLVWQGGGLNWKFDALLLDSAKETKTVVSSAIMNLNNAFWTVPNILGKYYLRLKCQNCP